MISTHTLLLRRPVWTPNSLDVGNYISQTAGLLKDYDEAINFYYDEAINFFVEVLGFALLEDTPDSTPHIPEAGKCRVVVSPRGAESRPRLSKTVTAE